MSTTIKALLRPSSAMGSSGTIIYRVCRHRRTAIVSSGIQITQQLWDSASQQMTDSCDIRLRKSEQAQQINECIKCDKKLLYDIATQLRQTKGETFTAHDVCVQFRQLHQMPSFPKFIQQEIERLQKDKRFSTAEKYHTSLRHLRRFLSTPDIPISSLTPQIIQQFEEYLLLQHVCPNSASAYMRSLSACYHRAIKAFELPDSHPFDNVFTGVAHTRKRAITQSVLRKIIDMDPPQSIKAALARDIFLFSFYARGMSLVDILYLRKENITGNILCYQRRKTGQWLQIHLEPCMKEILRRYASPTRTPPYLFPIITTSDAETAYHQYRHYLAAYNYQLRNIGKLLKLDIPLTGYVARHTWATAARNSGIATPIISACLGHTSERTTLIYLDSLDNNLLDKANRKIIGKLKHKKITALRKSGE